MNYSKINPFKFALAGGLVAVFCVVFTMFIAVLGVLPEYTALAIPWIEGVYIFLGLKLSLLGILLSITYSFIDGFIALFILAFLYNKLLEPKRGKRRF